MLCENCSKVHDGSYGSGRFCSAKCARGFSSKINRTETNRKIGNALSGKKQININRSKKLPHSKVFFHVCVTCMKPFTTMLRRTTCSIACRDAVRSRNGTLKKRILFYNVFESKNVILQSLWEVDIATWLTELELEWVRPTKPFIWFDATQAKKRTYLPDFFLPKFNLYLDVKNDFKQEQDKDKLRQLKLLFPLLIGDRVKLKEQVVGAIGFEPT